jgi:pimeloyl-ACP methyl ester carboxylesterase
VSCVDNTAFAAPRWFRAALRVPVQEATTVVDGTKIAYRAWGEPGDRGLVLIHGGAAHARWWDHIAPLLSDRWRVVAFDLSGHGDSGRRAAYDYSQWAREALAVAAAAGISGSPILIGHSMGGLAGLSAARLFSDRLAGVVAIDSPVQDTRSEQRAAQERRGGPIRIYPTRESAIAGFRVTPAQPMLSYIVDHVADTSVRQVERGWSWKFDPMVFTNYRLPPDLLTRLDSRVALFRAERGVVASDLSQNVFDRFGRLAPVIEIPDAGHHAMLDQPIALVTGIRALLASWDCESASADGP